MSNMLYDTCIIGAGPAGMTAAIYLGRAGKTVALLDSAGYGGNISKSPKVENIPGFASISGADFSANMYEQVLQYENIEHIICEAKLLRYDHGMFKLRTDENQLICSKSLIVATGTQHKPLTLDTPNIYYCVTCDGPLFKNKNVFVVGSGNTGAVYAEELSNYCNNVYICDVTMEMCCESVIAKQLMEKPNVHWLPNCSIVEAINTNDSLTAVKLSNYETVECSGIFAAIGMEANTAIVDNFVSKQDGFISTLPDCSTLIVPGLFAAGDCRVKDVRQVTTAVGDGTTAAISALKFLRGV